MNSQEYWQSCAMEAVREYELVVQSQRDELETLQRRCNDLLHERSMMKAATATDVRNFCFNYQADQQRKRGLTSSSAVDSIPIHTLLQFLHTYSNGLLPAPENKRKRSRFREDEENGSSAQQSLGPSAAVSTSQGDSFTLQQQQQQQQHRLYQRMLARQRTTGRLEEFQEEQAVLREEEHKDREHRSGPLGALARQQDRCTSAGGQRGGDGGGRGGPVVSASSFSLPGAPHPN